MGDTMKKQFFALLAIIACVASISLFDMNAEATSKLQVNVQSGIEGIQQSSKALPVKVSIKNEGSTFTGDVVVNGGFNYLAGAGHTKHITLKKGETTELQFLLEQYYEAEGKNQVQLYEGGYKKGKRVTYTGNGVIEKPKLNEEQSAIVSLDFTTKQADLFKVAVADNSDLMYENIKNFEAPTDYRYLDAISLLLVQGDTLAKWSMDQQHALALWIETGGTLYVQGDSSLPEELVADRPMALSNNVNTLSLEKLNSLFETTKQKIDVPIFEAQLKDEAQLMLGDDSQPLLAKTVIGKGAIIQSSFNQFPENQKVFTPLIEDVFLESSNTVDPSENIFNELGRSTIIFPAFHFSAIMVILILLAYVVVIAPILYIVLKKKDKREYAWWIIPSGAVLTSIILFAFSANGRLMNSKVQQASVISISDRQASMYFTQSVLTNKTGDIELVAPKNTQMARAFDYSKIETIHNKATFQENDKESVLNLRGLRYWDVATTVGTANVTDIGKFKVDLVIDKGYLKGTITNEVAYDVKNVEVWSGNEKYKIGTIKKGAMVEVNEKVKAQFLTQPMLKENNYIEDPIAKNELTTFQKEVIELSAMETISEMNQPVVVGWVDESIIPLKYKNLTTKQTNKNLLVQNFEPALELPAQFTVKNASFTLDAIDIGGDGYIDTEYEGNSWDVAEGQYELNYQMPANFPLEKVAWEQLQFRYTPTNATAISIYNFEESKYEKLTKKQTTLTKNIEHYISISGTIRFKLEAKIMESEIMAKPMLQLKGANTND